jgi:hypothetical protein
MAPILGAAGAVTSGAQYSMDRLAQKSFDKPQAEVLEACRQAMTGMQIKVSGVTTDGRELTVSGTTDEYPITVDLEPITPCLTKVTVTAGKTYFTLDRATGTAVVDRIGEILEEREKLAASSAALAEAHTVGRMAAPIAPLGQETPDTQGFRLYPEKAN